jgi:hypothetical protein
MKTLESELDTARWHIAQALQIIAAQQRRIAQLQSENRSTKDDEELLRTFLETLACLEDHAVLLESEIDDLKKGIGPWKGRPL